MDKNFPTVWVTPTPQSYVCHKQKKALTYKSHQYHRCGDCVHPIISKQPLKAERYFTEKTRGIDEQSLHGHYLHCNCDINISQMVSIVIFLTIKKTLLFITCT